MELDSETREIYNIVKDYLATMPEKKPTAPVKAPTYSHWDAEMQALAAELNAEREAWRKKQAAKSKP